MDDNVLLMVLILFVVICEAIAQSSANHLRHTDNYLYLLAGGLFYFMVVYLLSRAHKIAPMGLVNAVWSGLSIITIASVGYFAFDQKLTPDQIAVMGVIGLGVVYLAINVEPIPG